MSDLFLLVLAGHLLGDFVVGTTGSKNFATILWGQIATDQALHLSILAISFYWLAP